MKKIEACWLLHDLSFGKPDYRPDKRDALPQALAVDSDRSYHRAFKKNSSLGQDFSIK
ncbi:MAG: hypothetical protein JXR70_15770 [Spirochaetales bacterium]|nr:hypothetical protein [Spirochaetales bacterium]